MPEIKWFVLLHQRCVSLLTSKLRVLNHPNLNWNLHIEHFCPCSECAPFLTFCNSPVESKYETVTRLQKHMHLDEQINKYLVPVTATNISHRTRIYQKQDFHQDEKRVINTLTGYKQTLDNIFPTPPSPEAVAKVDVADEPPPKIPKLE